MPLLKRTAPFFFVLLWSTGFIGAKWGLPYAGALSFLSVRYGLVILMMFILALATRAPWPKGMKAWIHIGVSGLLIHGGYLAGVFEAIGRGQGAGITALVVGLQPLLTATLVSLVLHEKVSTRQWLGLILGIIGIGLVVSGKIGAFHLHAFIPSVVALISITIGTLYQKRFSPHFDWRSGAVVQFLPTALITLPFAWALEGFRVELNSHFIFALAWLVLVLSVGAISLLNFLIRTGSSVHVSSLFYLTPPTTALLAWLVFDEIMSPIMIIGMLLAVVGVVLARR